MINAHAGVSFKCLSIKGSVQLVLYNMFSLIFSAHDNTGSSCSRQQGKQPLHVMHLLQSPLCSGGGAA